MSSPSVSSQEAIQVSTLAGEKDSKEVIEKTNEGVLPNHEVTKKQADVTFDLMNQLGDSVPELTPEKEKRLKRKLWLTVVPIVFLVNATLFIDKDAIAYASLLGVFKDMNITKNQYNNILTVFYAGYILGQAPSHYLFQRLRMSVYLTITVATWCLLNFATLGSKSYIGMAILRFFLGFVEAGVTPAVSHTIAMFFTLEEQQFVSPIFWISCLGIDVPFGFVSYGLQFTTAWRPWKWFWLLIAIWSGLVAVFVFFFYPDNPATSRLFSIEERIHIIQRVKKSTNSAIEQKTFKWYQFKECLLDPISILFFIFCLFLMLENSTTYQSSIIYSQLGFSNLTTNLLMVVTNGYGTFCAIVGSIVLSRWRSQAFYVAVIMLIGPFVGAILAITLPYENKAGILAGIFMTRSNGTAYIIGLNLTHATSAGYTKRLTRTFLFMIAYSISNLIAPQLWQSRFAPRYRESWVVQIIFSWFLAPCVLLIIRYILSKRNKERRKLIEEDVNGELEYGIVDVTDDDGNVRKEVTHISMLDLTDLENKKFIYPL